MTGTPTLKYTVNAVVALERALKMPVAKIGAALDDADNVGIELLRTVFWAGLLHERPGLTEDEAGDIMTEMGFKAAGDAISDAFQASFGGAENPPPKDGTGTRTSPPISRSASTRRASGG